MTNIENEYRGLMAGILHGGLDKADRTGTGTKSVFGRTIRHDMQLGFIGDQIMSAQAEQMKPLAPYMEPNGVILTAQISLNNLCIA